MNTTRLLPMVTVVILAALPLTAAAQKFDPPSPPGAYYSAQRPYTPPFPFNPFPDLPTVEVEPKRFVYDDTQVDYGAMRMQSASTVPSPPGEGGGGGTNIPPYLPPTVPIPGVPLLKIEVFDSSKIVSFNTIPGLVYRLEQTTNLSNPVWVTVEEFVATSTNSDFTVEENAMAFYRVFQEDDKIQFPDWFDTIYQYLRFDVYSPVAGTYAMELYADGELAFSNATTIPPDGHFLVHDTGYNPADWPNSGYYGVSEWELRVTVTPAAGGGGGGGGAAIHRNVKKRGVQRNPFGTYKGMTVELGGIFNSSTTAQDEVDESMHFCMLAMYQACEIVDWNFNFADVAATDRSYMPGNATIYDTNQWDRLRQWITRRTPTNTLSGNTLDYFHYMGHGSPSSIAGSNATERITISQLLGSQFMQGSKTLKTNLMTYVALDGCRTSKNTDFLKAFVGYGSRISRTTLALKGQDPHFGCGWDDTKFVQWVLQGVKNDNHFYFWEDYYFFLTRRDNNGFMFTQYKDAHRLAKDPMGGGVNNVLQTNPEATGFKMVGCDDCRFDERPGIVQ